MHLGSHACPLVAKLGVKLNDIALLIWRKGSFLKIWTQMVGPPQTAAFATTKETRVLLHGVPVAFPVLAHIRHQNGILGRRPRTFLQIPRIHEDLLWQIHDRYHQEQVSALLPAKAPVQGWRDKRTRLQHKQKLVPHQCDDDDDELQTSLLSISHPTFFHTAHLRTPPSLFPPLLPSNSKVAPLSWTPVLPAPRSCYVYLQASTRIFRNKKLLKELGAKPSEEEEEEAAAEEEEEDDDDEGIEHEEEGRE
jgi:hypothetical protein